MEAQNETKLVIKNGYGKWYMHIFMYACNIFNLLELSTFNTEEVKVELVLILTHTTHEVTSSTNLLTQIRERQ